MAKLSLTAGLKTRIELTASFPPVYPQIQFVHIAWPSSRIWNEKASKAVGKFTNSQDVICCFNVSSLGGVFFSLFKRQYECCFLELIF